MLLGLLTNSFQIDKRQSEKLNCLEVCTSRIIRTLQNIEHANDIDANFANMLFLLMHYYNNKSTGSEVIRKIHYTENIFNKIVFALNRLSISNSIFYNNHLN